MKFHCISILIAIASVPLVWVTNGALQAILGVTGFIAGWVANFALRAHILHPELPLIHGMLDVVFNKRVIVNCEREPYLHRWYVIRTPWFGLFIHKFVRSDEDRALHDHPWPFIVIPIWRGYWEHSMRAMNLEQMVRYAAEAPGHEFLRPGAWPMYHIMRRVYPILGTRFRPATYQHRVELLRNMDQWGIRAGRCDELPAWSIFIRFKEIREWGFQLPTGWVSWKQWWSDKCE